MILPLSAGLHAQQAAPPPDKTRTDGDSEKVVTLPAMSVTGSYIKRLDIEKVLPVTVISKEALEFRNAFTPIDQLTALPQVTNIPLNEAASGPAAARGDMAAINLRGIGSGNSLLLLNGRRLAPHPISGAEDGVPSFSVNVNQLPTQGISHIDVLRDGASSIYGSDAVAGVVNYITDRDFRGTELKTRYGFPEAGGGETVHSTLTYGRDFAGGRGHLLSTLDLLYRDAIYHRQRSVSETSANFLHVPAPWNIPGSIFDRRMAIGYYPTFRIGTATATNWFRPVNNVLTLTSAAPTRTDNPEYWFHANRYSMGQPRSNRLNWVSVAEYNLTDRITAFADFSIYRSDSTLTRQPLRLTAPVTDAAAPMSVDNPFNPYGSRFYHASGAPNADGTPRLVGAPRPVTLLTGLVNGLPGEAIDIESKAYRIVGGLRGRVFDAWNWESGALFTRANTSDVTPLAVRESLFQNALMRTDNTAYNPFGSTFKVQGGAVVADQPYTNPQSVISSFVDERRREGMSEIASLDARAVGRVFTLWSGDVSLAIGSEYRWEKYKEHRPGFAGMNPAGSGLDPNDNDYLFYLPAADSGGTRSISSYYAETVVPLTAPKNRVPLVKSLELTASVRHERYDDFGNTTKPKVGLNWKPVEILMVRGSFNEGFTAPNLPTLYAPTRYGSGPQFDRYRNPVTNEGTYVMQNVTLGNPDLKPVDSTGKTAGVVFEVPRVRGLTLTADYWEISQSNVIGPSRTIAQIFDSDAALLQAYTRQQIAAGVPVGSIDLGSGTAAYKGDADVIRYAPTAAAIATFAAYNAANPGSPQAVAGQIFTHRSRPLNLAEGSVSGWDFGLNYNLPVLPIGRISVTSDWAYLRHSYTINRPPGVVPTFMERLGVGANARWRNTTVFSWRKGSWAGGLSAYYIGSGTDASATTTEAVYESLGRPAYIVRQFDANTYVYQYRMEGTLTCNVSASYQFGLNARAWLRQSTVRVGVVNLNNMPPRRTSGDFGYSPAAPGTLFIGRTWTMELTKRF